MPHFKNCSVRSQEVTLAGDARETRRAAVGGGEAKLSGPVRQLRPERKLEAWKKRGAM